MASSCALLFVAVFAAFSVVVAYMPRDDFCGTLPKASEDVIWTPSSELGEHGRGWPLSKLPCPYCRLPTSAQGVVTNTVWSLSQTPTGFYTGFSTNADTVWIRFNVTQVEGGDWLWPIGGHNGVDLYVSDAATVEAAQGVPNSFRWATSSGNNAHLAQTVAAQGSRNVSFTMVLGPMTSVTNNFDRNFTVYFPPRGSLASLEIGVASGASTPVTVTPYEDTNPVVLYGTSIVHGAASQRPGMVWSSQLSRLLRRTVLNLGFSGNGKMQPGSSQVLSELSQAAVFVLDCQYNMNGMAVADVQNRTESIVHELRESNPDTPILIVEGHPPTRGWMSPGMADSFNRTSAGYRLGFNALISGPAPVKGVHFLTSALKFGGPIATDFQAQVSAVGGVHPSPLAFTAMARYVGGAVQRILNGTAPTPAPLPIPPYTRTPHQSAQNNSAQGSGSSSHSDDAEVAPADAAAVNLVWQNGSDLGYDGNGWPTEAPVYGRFPAAAQADLEASTWGLSMACSGCMVRFQSDADQIFINIVRNLTTHDKLQDDIMPFNGRFGADVYAQDEATGAWRWFQTSTGGSQSANEMLRLSDMPPLAAGAVRNYTVYLPTHAVVTDVRVGVEKQFQLKPLHLYPASTPPIVLWGSSIAQGGVVQNGGMTWPVSLQRLANLPLLNFGFSGNCRFQPSTAEWIGKLATKPRVLLVDCLPNVNADLVNKTAASTVRQLRQALGKDVPIVLLEGHTYTNAWVLPEVADAQQAKRQAQQAVFAALRAEDPNLLYMHGDGKLLGLGSELWHEATAGIGVHPSSIAHLHIARYVHSQLKANAIL
eukprot:m.33204 g.33204  ORF g.33204 m.33204 type:complete len:819 (+) comp10314_c0_seq1:107-2563(+)